MKPLWRLYHDGMLVGYFIDEALLNKTMEVIGGGKIRDDYYCDKVLKKYKVYRASIYLNNRPVEHYTYDIYAEENNEGGWEYGAQDAIESLKYGMCWAFLVYDSFISQEHAIEQLIAGKEKVIAYLNENNLILVEDTDDDTLVKAVLGNV